MFLKSCDKVISVSRFLSEEMERKAGLENTEVIYNGIDTSLFKKDKFRKDAEQKRAQYGISGEDFVIAFAGRLVEEKGIRLLVDALELIPEEYQVVLLIIGSSFFGKSRGWSD